MRTAVTLALRHGATRAEMILGTEVPVFEHRSKFSEACYHSTHAEFAAIEVWESDIGVTMRRSFAAPKVAPEASSASDGGSLHKRGTFGTKK